jgi:adenylate kinase
LKNKFIIDFELILILYIKFGNFFKMKDNIIIFFGPPGAGKGTQSSFISSKFNLPHLSTGDMLRHACKKGDDFAKQLTKIMNSGELVSDDIIINVIKNRIAEKDCENGFLLDGFPRTIAQSKALSKMLEEMNRKIRFVFNFHVEDVELKNRMRKRALEQVAKGEKPREDDNDIAFENRLKVYRKQTAPVLEYYLKTSPSIVKEIDGTISIKQVNEVLEGAITAT